MPRSSAGVAACRRRLMSVTSYDAFMKPSPGPSHWLGARIRDMHCIVLYCTVLYCTVRACGSSLHRPVICGTETHSAQIMERGRGCDLLSEIVRSEEQHENFTSCLCTQLTSCPFNAK